MKGHEIANLALTDFAKFENELEELGICDLLTQHQRIDLYAMHMGKVSHATARAEAAELRLKEANEILAKWHGDYDLILKVYSFESENYHSLTINKSDNPLDALLQAVKGLKGEVK